MGSILIQAGGIDDVHSPKQPEGGIPRLRQTPAWLEARGQLAREQALETREVRVAEQPLDRLGAGDLHERRGRLVTQAQAGTAEPDRVVLAKCDVVAVRTVMVR